MTLAQVAADLRAAIDEGTKLFESADDARTLRRTRPGSWCAREVVGHLIDSACNNHRRFVVGQLPATTRFDGYDQDEWVSRQNYDSVTWADLVALWTAYNRHLAHLMSCIPDAAALRTALAPDGSRQVSVAFLMEDYVRHLRHHLDQLRNLLAA